MSSFLLKLIFISIFITISSSAKILFLYPCPSKSHMVIVHTLSTILAERGHEVTVVSPHPLTKEIKNHREIKSEITIRVNELTNRMVQKANKMDFSDVTEVILARIEMGVETAKSEEFKKLLDEKFDLLIIGMMFHNFLLGFGDHFKCPTVMLSVQRHFTFTSEIMGNPIEPHTIPIFGSDGGSGFIWRLKNFISIGKEYMNLKYFDDQQKLAYEKLFPTTKYRSYEDSLKNVSLALINDHFANGSPRPLVPATVEIKGIQLNPNLKELPKDIKNFLDNSDNGAIYFSLGSNAKTTLLSEEKSSMFLKTFEKLKFNFIMKWDEEIENLPKNIFVGKWLPQSEILAHKNVKLFISHCGLGGMVESKYHGVPVLAIPIFGDQPLNSKEAVKEGWAVELNFNELNEKVLHDAIIEMIQNRTYSDVVKKLSLLDRDRPMNARDTAIYWIEYVARHHGAPHMQYPAVYLNFWQRNSLDVIGFLMFCCLIILLITLKIFQVILKLILKIFKNYLIRNKHKKQ